jgi:hypothetical protein
VTWDFRVDSGGRTIGEAHVNIPERSNDLADHFACGEPVPALRVMWVAHLHAGLVALCEECRTHSYEQTYRLIASRAPRAPQTLAKPTKTARDVRRERDERTDGLRSVTKRREVASQVAEEVRLLEQDAGGLRKPID